MPLATADPTRIRRVIRAAEYARTSNSSVLVQRPTANDGYASPREGFFDLTADAQILLDELAGVLQADRRHEAVETDTPFALGRTLAITPTVPKARVIDTSNAFDRTMLIRGVAIDLGSDRNSIEAIG